jgi:hypothetical protein
MESNLEENAIRDAADVARSGFMVPSVTC